MSIRLPVVEIWSKLTVLRIEGKCPYRFRIFLSVAGVGGLVIQILISAGRASYLPHLAGMGAFGPNVTQEGSVVVL